MTALPGDQIVPKPDLVMDRLLHLPAPPNEVWPWLVQLGKHRAGWYMPEAVERWLIPPSRRATRRVEPQWQHLEVGDEIDDWGGRDAKFTLAEIDPPRSLVWVSTRARRSKQQPRPPMVFSWAQVLDATADGGSELRLRLRIDLGGGRTWLARYGGGAIDWATVALLERGLRERLTASPG